MMVKARLRRMFAVAFGAVIALALPVTAYAAETTPGVTVIGEESTVTVHVFNNNNESATSPGTGGEVEAGGMGSPLEGATLGYLKVGELAQYTEGGSTSLKYAVRADVVGSLNPGGIVGWTEVTIDDVQHYLLDADELAGLISGKTSSGVKEQLERAGVGPQWVIAGPTDANGSVAIERLSGLYLFIGETMPSNVTNEVAPFFVSAPMPSDGDWNTDIHVYPKVQTAQAVSITHMVRYAAGTDEDYKADMSADAGTPLQYRIQVTIPEDVKNLASFTVTDELAAAIACEEGSAGVTSSGPIQLLEGDYTLSVSGNELAFALTPSGLAKFSQIQGASTTLDITYQAKISNTAPLAASIANTAMLSYEFSGSTGEIGADATATVYTYGIDLTKTFEGAGSYQPGARFQLFQDEACQHAVKVSGVEGAYWVDADGASADMSVAQAADGGIQGSLTLKGLAAGTYYLKEVAAPSGYGKLQNPVKVEVSVGGDDDLAAKIENPTAKVNDVDATIASGDSGADAGLVKLTVENQKMLFGFLPQTGDAGTLLLVATGIGLMALATIFLAGRRTKRTAR